MLMAFFVGEAGFEPTTTRPPDEYSTGLSYSPICVQGVGKIAVRLNGERNYERPLENAKAFAGFMSGFQVRQ